MAHWAEINENNVVTRVLVGDNNDPAGDEGYQWLIDNLGGNWVKTSYNAAGGKRRNPDTGEMTNEPGFRKNYAGIGFTYDSTRDAFIPPKPFNSWVLNEDTCLWEAPVAYPAFDEQNPKYYVWNEETLNWDEIQVSPPLSQE
jgi:hypothetical protein